MSRTQTIHPVILPVSIDHQQLKGRDKVAALRGQARKALALSAQYSRMPLGDLRKNENGAPLPSNGVYWSLSHKSAYVAAVTALIPVGIDVERLKPVSQGLEKRVADQAEWSLAPKLDPTLFFRYWTAKEAVLKAVGTGLTGLSNCRVEQIINGDHLRLAYENQIWTVTHHWIGQNHLVAVTSGHMLIEWHVQ